MKHRINYIDWILLFCFFIQLLFMILLYAKVIEGNRMISSIQTQMQDWGVYEDNTNTEK